MCVLYLNSKIQNPVLDLRKTCDYIPRRPLGRSKRRWKDNIKMDLHEVGWGGMEWVDMAQDKDR